MPRISHPHALTGSVEYATGNGPQTLSFVDGVADVDPADAAAALRCLPGSQILDSDPDQGEQDEQQGDAEIPVEGTPPAGKSPKPRSPRIGTEENPQS